MGNPAKEHRRKKRRGDQKVTDGEWLFAYYIVRYGDPVKAIEFAYPANKDRTRPQKYDLAKRIKNRPKVRSQIEQLQAEARASERLTLEQHMQQLADLRDKSVQTEQMAAAVKAEELRGRVAGFYIERHQHVHEVRSEDEIKQRLIFLMKQYPSMQQMLSQQMRDQLQLEADQERKPVESQPVHQSSASEPKSQDRPDADNPGTTTEPYPSADQA